MRSRYACDRVGLIALSGHSVDGKDALHSENTRIRTKVPINCFASVPRNFAESPDVISAAVMEHAT